MNFFLLPTALPLALLVLVICENQLQVLGGILYPKDSETRQKVSLDGLWKFIPSNSTNPLRGFEEKWYEQEFKDLEDQDVQDMPVPASYNDIGTSWELREHVGVVWYEKIFFVSKLWQKDLRVWLRFGSVSYAAQVWLNGELVMAHEIGHLPFQRDITKFLKFGKENKITVSCDNTLLSDTIPQGTVVEIESGRLTQEYTFDFFNYAGIDRSVILYTTPENYIDDVTVSTESADQNLAVLSYEIDVISNGTNFTCKVSVLDQNKTSVSAQEGLKGSITVASPNLWWPYLMEPYPGYLYTLQAEIFDDGDELIDTYSLYVGIRTLYWNNTSFLINDRPIYLHGFGKHEDSDIRGKGLDFPTIVRDFNLIKWIGANAFRTSHYPYAEEIMDLADSMGIMVIDECPAVNADDFGDSLLKKHKQSLTELIQRDKNRPSVIMWSAANEPRSQKPKAEPYFKAVIEHIKQLDTSRPTTIIISVGVIDDKSGQFVDILSFNKYNGWYDNVGLLDVITDAVEQEAKDWFKKLNKPVILQEYGADTIEGLHSEPSFVWSEEYQVALMSQHFKAFDKLKASGFFIGEFIWNFADFKTAQNIMRVGGNKKGIFTRSRQPKNSAHHLRRRYWSLAKNLYNATVPKDLEYYISENSVHDEL